MLANCGRVLLRCSAFKVPKTDRLTLLQRVAITHNVLLSLSCTGQTSFNTNYNASARRCYANAATPGKPKAHTGKAKARTGKTTTKSSTTVAKKADSTIEKAASATKKVAGTAKKAVTNKKASPVKKKPSTKTASKTEAEPPKKDARKRPAKKPLSDIQKALVAMRKEKQEARKEKQKALAAKRKAKEAKRREKEKALAAKRKALVAKPNEKKKKKEKERQEKEKLAQLKKTALMGIFPKKANDSVFSVVLAELDKEVVKGLTARSKQASAKSKDLTPEELEHYNHIANQNRATYKAAYRKVLDSHTPDQIRMANHARRQLKRRYKVRHGVLQIHDERQVKGVSTAFNAFFTERTDSGDFRHMKVADIGRLVGSEWRGLTNEEKDKYYKLQKLDRSRYELEVKTVYGRGIEGPPALNAAT